MMLQNGPLGLRIETARGQGTLLGKQSFCCVGGVRLSQCVGTVVQPSIGVGAHVSVVSVRKELAADVVHGQCQISASVIDETLCSSIPMNAIVGDHLGPTSR